MAKVLTCTAGHHTLLTVLLGHTESLQRYYCFWVPLLFITQFEAPQCSFQGALSSCFCKPSAWLGSCPSFLHAHISQSLSALRDGFSVQTAGRAGISVALPYLWGQPDPQWQQNCSQLWPAQVWLNKHAKHCHIHQTPKENAGRDPSGRFGGFFNHLNIFSYCTFLTRIDKLVSAEQWPSFDPPLENLIPTTSRGPASTAALPSLLLLHCSYCCRLIASTAIKS